MAEEWSVRGWEDEQLDEARVSGENRDAVRRLLDAYRAGTGEYKVDRDLVVRTFTQLASGLPLVAQDEPDAVWRPITQSGQVHSRDLVRVRLDAYTDEAGRFHNGRHGRVIAVRYGDVVVRYEDGRQPPFDGVHHPPTALEKRIK